MRAESIREHLRKQPFQAFRIHLSDGSSYDIRHPEMAIASQREVLVGIGPEDNGLPERFVFCTPVHITRIEPLSGNQTNGQRQE